MAAYRCEIHFHQQDNATVVTETDVTDENDAAQMEAWLLSYLAIWHMLNLGPPGLANPLAKELKEARRFTKMVSMGGWPSRLTNSEVSTSAATKGYAGSAFWGADSDLNCHIKEFGFDAVEPDHQYYGPLSVSILLEYFAGTSKTATHLDALGITAELCSAMHRHRHLTADNFMNHVKGVPILAWQAATGDLKAQKDVEHMTAW